MEEGRKPCQRLTRATKPDLALHVLAGYGHYLQLFDLDSPTQILFEGSHMYRMLSTSVYHRRASPSRVRQISVGRIF